MTEDSHLQALKLNSLLSKVISQKCPKSVNSVQATQNIPCYSHVYLQITLLGSNQNFFLWYLSEVGLEITRNDYAASVEPGFTHILQGVL